MLNFADTPTKIHFVDLRYLDTKNHDLSSMYEAFSPFPPLVLKIHYVQLYFEPITTGGSKRPTPLGLLSGIQKVIQMELKYNHIITTFKIRETLLIILRY